MSHCLVLFDSDGCTSVVPTTKVDIDARKGGHYEFLYQGKRHLVEVLDISDSKAELDTFERSWQLSSRASVLSMRKEVGDGKEGGYLSCHPVTQSFLPVVELRREDVVELRRDVTNTVQHTQSSKSKTRQKIVKTLGKAASRCMKAISSKIKHVKSVPKPISRKKYTLERAMNNERVSVELKSKKFVAAVPKNATKRKSTDTSSSPVKRIKKPVGVSCISSAVSKPCVGKKTLKSTKMASVKTNQTTLKSKFVEKGNKKKVGTNGRVLNILFEGDMETIDTGVEAQRQPIHLDHLTTDQADSISMQMHGFANNKISVGTQTCPVIVLTCDNELKEFNINKKWMEVLERLEGIESKIEVVLPAKPSEGSSSILLCDEPESELFSYPSHLNAQLSENSEQYTAQPLYNVETSTMTTQPNSQISVTVEQPNSIYSQGSEPVDYCKTVVVNRSPSLANALPRSDTALMVDQAQCLYPTNFEPIGYVQNDVIDRSSSLATVNRSPSLATVNRSSSHATIDRSSSLATVNRSPSLATVQPSALPQHIPGQVGYHYPADDNIPSLANALPRSDTALMVDQAQCLYPTNFEPIGYVQNDVIDRSPSLATVKRSPSLATVNRSSSHATVDRSSSLATVNMSSSLATVNRSPSLATVNRSSSHATVDRSSSLATVNRSPSLAIVQPSALPQHIPCQVGYHYSADDNIPSLANALPRSDTALMVDQAQCLYPTNFEPIGYVQNDVIDRSSSLATVNRSPSLATVNRSSSHATVDRSSSLATVNMSPSLATVNRSPSLATVNRSSSHATVDRSSSIATVNRSPSLATVQPPALPQQRPGQVGYHYPADDNTPTLATSTVPKYPVETSTHFSASSLVSVAQPPVFQQPRPEPLSQIQNSVVDSSPSHVPARSVQSLQGSSVNCQQRLPLFYAQRVHFDTNSVGQVPFHSKLTTNSTLYSDINSQSVKHSPPIVSQLTPKVNTLCPVTASVLNRSFVEISSHQDMQFVPPGVNVKIQKDALNSLMMKYSHSISLLGWRLAQTVYREDEMYEKNFNGRGKPFLSPRRKKLIQEVIVDYFPGPQNLKAAVGGINTGIRGLRRKRLTSLSEFL